MRMKNKTQILYDKFKEEAVLCNLINTSGDKVIKKKVIRFRGKTYLTASFQEVFNSIKHDLTLS